MRAVFVSCAVVLTVVFWPRRATPYWESGSSPRWRRELSGRLAGPGAEGSEWPWWPWWPGWLGRPGRRSRDPTAEVLDLLDAVAPALRAGLAPAAALRAVRAAADGGGLAAELLAAADLGAPLGAIWRRQAGQTGSADLALVAAAWSLCDALGSPLAPTVVTVADLLRRRQAVQRRVEVAVAGPRATMRLLVALPAVGPLLAMSVGVSPTQLYASPAGLAPLAVGTLLLLAGWRWSRRLVLGVVRERHEA